jgi:hypothetical protein
MLPSCGTGDCEGGVQRRTDEAMSWEEGGGASAAVPLPSPSQEEEAAPGPSTAAGPARPCLPAGVVCGGLIEGVMIGRAAYNDPWGCLGDADRAVFGETANGARSRREVRIPLAWSPPGLLLCCLLCSSWLDYACLLGVVLSGICTLWDLYSLGFVLSGICTLWDLYSLGFVLSGSCTLWELYSLGFVLSGSCTLWDLYSLGFVLSGMPQKAVRQLLCATPVGLHAILAWPESSVLESVLTLVPGFRKYSFVGFAY